jgi:hypothetical protein
LVGHVASVTLVGGLVILTVTTSGNPSSAFWPSVAVGTAGIAAGSLLLARAAREAGVTRHVSLRRLCLARLLPRRLPHGGPQLAFATIFMLIVVTALSVSRPGLDGGLSVSGVGLVPARDADVGATLPSGPRAAKPSSEPAPRSRPGGAPSPRVTAVASASNGDGLGPERRAATDGSSSRSSSSAKLKHPARGGSSAVAPRSGQGSGERVDQATAGRDDDWAIKIRSLAAASQGPALPGLESSQATASAAEPSSAGSRVTQNALTTTQQAEQPNQEASAQDPSQNQP